METVKRFFVNHFEWVLVAILFVLAFAYSSHAKAAEPVIAQLQDVSVTIRSGGGQGSGVLFTREVDGETRTFVWTAAHVIDNLRKTRDVVVNGSRKTVVEFADVELVQEFRQDGRRIGEQKMDCRVVRYSDADQGEDLALLEVRKRNFVPASTTVTFYDGPIPAVGTELFHIGSLLGQFGSNSLTTGVVSQIGRVLDLGANGVIFDQSTVTAFPGSSGGGVFLKSNGQYIGMLVRGAGEQFNFIVPVRRLRAWAKRANIEWAIDSSIPLPSAAVLAKLPIEDVGAEFDPFRVEAANKEFPFLINRGG